MNNLVNILEKLGYRFRKNSNYYQTKALYRGGKDISSVAIYPQDNFFIDFVTNEKGSLQKLIALTLKLNESEAIEWLKKNGIQYVPKTNEKPQITMPKIFPKECLQDLMPIHDYWVQQGIKPETLSSFSSGISHAGRMKGRYVFPIFDANENIIGFVGRDILNDPTRPKYKIVGPKNEFIWPLMFTQHLSIVKKFVILVESPHCILRLWDINVHNTLCLFGIELSVPQVNTLLRLDPEYIIISTNNEPGNKNIGNTAAIKIAQKLVKYFDKNQIKIVLPFKKDFGEQTREENMEWFRQLNTLLENGRD